MEGTEGRGRAFPEKRQPNEQGNTGGFTFDTSRLFGSGGRQYAGIQESGEFGGLPLDIARGFPSRH